MAARGPWWTNSVLSSVEPVVRRASHVFVDEAAVADVASWLAFEEFGVVGKGEATGPLHVSRKREDLIDWIFLLNTINFAYTDFSTRQVYKYESGGSILSDAEAALAALHAALVGGTPLLSGHWMVQVDVAQLREIFHPSDGRGGACNKSPEIPMLAERAAVLNGVGRVLVERFGGQWHRWVADCAPALYAPGGQGLLQRLGEDFPRFKDVASWSPSPRLGVVGDDGAPRRFEVVIMKLGQLAIWSAHQVLLQAGAGPLISDVEQLTAMADYIVPFALGRLRILRLDPALEEAIRVGSIVPSGGPEEVELRAASIYAVARLTDEVNALRPATLQLVQAQLDYRLWKSYHATHGRHHLTITTFY